MNLQRNGIVPPPKKQIPHKFLLSVPQLQTKA